MMEKIKNFFQKPLVLLFLSALLSALPFTFPSLFLLSWVGFVPFFAVLLTSSGSGKWLSALGRGLFFGFCYHALIYYWFLWLYPLDFAGLSKASSLGVVCLAWLGIAFLHGILFAIPTLLCHFISKWTRNRPFLLFAGIFGVLLAQKITEFSELAFPWCSVSIGQYRAPALIQSASLLGREGVDLLILSVSALVTLGLFSKDKKKILSFSLAATLFAGNLTFGVISLSGKEKEETLSVSLIQGNLLSGEKWEEGSSLALERYLSLTESVSEGNRLVVWPESAVPANLFTHGELTEHYSSLAKEKGISFLMGAFWKQDGVSTNSALIITENGVEGVYSKRNLVPFGEKMPYRPLFSKLFPFLEEINLLSSDLAHGTDTGIMEWEEKELGTVICFESLFSGLVRESVNDGAEVLFVLTNDSWYKDSPATSQHLAHSVFRSVENGRSLVRCANSGISAIIDEKGRIREELGALEMGILEGEVSLCRDRTLYSVLGNVTLPALGVVFVLWSGALLILQERRKRRGRTQ